MQLCRGEALGDAVLHDSPHARRQVGQRIFESEGTLWGPRLGPRGLGANHDTATRVGGRETYDEEGDGKKELRINLLV